MMIPSLPTRRLRACWLAALLALLPTSLVLAQGTPTAFTYQGLLTESGQPATGLYDFNVCIYENDDEIDCLPDFEDVPVDGGLFTLTLDFGSLVFSGPPRFLGIGVRPETSTGAFTPLLPRQRLRPSPEAIRAHVASAAPWSGLSGVPVGFADGVDDAGSGTVSSVSAGTGLDGGTITTSGTISIANGGVGPLQIANTAVRTEHLAPGAVGTGQLALGAVTSDRIAPGAVDDAALADDAVFTDAIQDQAVNAAKIAPGAVGSTHVDPAQVQRRVNGACAIGTYLRGINDDGSVTCTELPIPSLISKAHDPANTVGSFTSIAIGADGLPVASFYDETAEALLFARCANAACSGPAFVSTIDVGTSVGQYSSMAIGADGFPVISYFDAFMRALKVAKCSNPKCTMGTVTLTTVDNPSNRVGLHTSIAIGSDGFPIISYEDMDAGALKVAKCTNAACSGAVTISFVDDPGNIVGGPTSIAIGHDNLPVIAYQDKTAGDLKVARCANTACTGTATITVVDATGSVGGNASLAIGTDGRPVISYSDGTAGSLKVARCGNAACTGAATITTVDDPANTVGLFTAIAVPADGLPVISYWDVTATALKVVKCSDAACTGSNFPVIADDSGVSGRYSDMAIGTDGLPVISHQSDGALSIVKCGNRSCR